MSLTVALFGIAREIVGKSLLTVAAGEGQSVGELLAILRRDYPELGRLRSLAVAVNNEYAGEEVALHERDDVALIPPVSGG